MNSKNNEYGLSIGVLEQDGEGLSVSSAGMARNDEVNNTIHALLNQLVPDDYRREEDVEWDMEGIANVRDAIVDVLCDSLGLEGRDRDRFEMQFAPYVEEL